MRWVYITSDDDFENAWEIARDYLEGAKGQGALHPRVTVVPRKGVFWIMRAEEDREE